MPNWLRRTKRKVKIVKKTPKVQGAFKTRVKAHSLSGGLMATQMAADEIRGKGTDYVTRAFDRRYFKLNKKKPQHQQIGDSHMERQDIHEVFANIAARLAARQAAKLASRKGSQKVATATAQKAATSIAHRVAPKVTKPSLELSKRMGKGPIKAMKRLAHRTHARARLHRRIVSKETRLRPLTAMAKGAMKTAAADTALRTVVDVGSHVGGSVAKQHADKIMKTPKKFSAQQQAADRQRENYRQVVQNLFEKKKPYIETKKYGQNHDTHNAIIALHRQNSSGGKALSLPANNPSGPSKTNTRSVQNSEYEAVADNIMEFWATAGNVVAKHAVNFAGNKTIKHGSRSLNKVAKKFNKSAGESIEEVGLGVVSGLVAVQKAQVNFAKGVSKRILKPITKKPVSESPTLLAIAGGTLLGGLATEVAIKAGKAGYKKAKPAIAKAKTAISKTRVANAIQKIRKTNQMNKQTQLENFGEEDMDREELIQEIMATTAIGVGATSGWAARRLVKRNKINKGIYARKAARTERRAKGLEFKAKITRGLDRQIGKGKARRLSGKASRLQKKIAKTEKYKQLAAQNEGYLSEIVDPEPSWHKTQRRQEKLGKLGKILSPRVMYAKGKKEDVSEGYLNWLTKKRMKKAGKLRMKAAKYRATSADFASREQRGLQKKLAKVQRKQARYESKEEPSKTDKAKSFLKKHKEKIAVGAGSVAGAGAAYGVHRGWKNFGEKMRHKTSGRVHRLSSH